MLSTTGLGAWGFLLLGGSIVWKPRKLPSSVERTRETTAINRHFLDDSTVSLVSLCWTNRRKFWRVWKHVMWDFQCETAISGCINNPYPPGKQQISPNTAFWRWCSFSSGGICYSSLEASCLELPFFLPCKKCWGNWRPAFVRHCEVTSGLGVAAAFYAAAKVGWGKGRLSHLTKLLGKQSTVGD